MARKLHNYLKKNGELESIAWMEVGQSYSIQLFVGISKLYDFFDFIFWTSYGSGTALIAVISVNGNIGY